MSEMIDFESFKSMGQISYSIVLILMGMISTLYIKSLIKKIESLPDVTELIKRISTLISKVDDLSMRLQSSINRQEISELTNNLKIESFEKRLSLLESFYDSKNC